MPRRRDWAASCTAAPALRGEPHRRSLRVPSRSDACGLLPFREFHALGPRPNLPDEDRKSTRLNSSHGYISYAVFCLKKKKKHNIHKHSTRLYRTDTTRTREHDERPM